MHPSSGIAYLQPVQDSACRLTGGTEAADELSHRGLPTKCVTAKSTEEGKTGGTVQVCRVKKTAGMKGDVKPSRSPPQDGNVTYLLVELDVGGLELRLDVAGACVVGELHVRDRHALGSLRGCKVALGRSGHSVQRHRLVLRVSDLVQMNVGDLLVLNDCRVVRRRVAWQLGEVL